MGPKKGVLFSKKRTPFLGSFLGPFRDLLGAPRSLIFGSRGAREPKNGPRDAPKGSREGHKTSPKKGVLFFYKKGHLFLGAFLPPLPPLVGALRVFLACALGLLSHRQLTLDLVFASRELLLYVFGLASLSPSMDSHFASLAWILDSLPWPLSRVALMHSRVGSFF